MPSDIEEVAVVEARASLEEEKLVCDVVGNEKVEVGEKTQGTTVVIKPCSRKKKQKIDDDGNVKDDKEKLVCDVVGNEKVQVGEKTQGTTVLIKPCRQIKQTIDDKGNVIDYTDTSSDDGWFENSSSEEESYFRKEGSGFISDDEDEDEDENNPYANIRPYDGKMYSRCSIIEGTDKMVHSHFWFTRSKKKIPKKKSKKKFGMGPRLRLDKHVVKPELFSTDPDEQDKAMMKQCSRCYSKILGVPWGLKSSSKKRRHKYY